MSWCSTGEPPCHRRFFVAVPLFHRRAGVDQSLFCVVAVRLTEGPFVLFLIC